MKRSLILVSISLIFVLFCLNLVSAETENVKIRVQIDNRTVKLDGSGIDDSVFSCNQDAKYSILIPIEYDCNNLNTDNVRNILKDEFDNRIESCNIKNTELEKNAQNMQNEFTEYKAKHPNTPEEIKNIETQICDSEKLSQKTKYTTWIIVLSIICFIFAIMTLILATMMFLKRDKDEKTKTK